MAPLFKGIEAGRIPVEKGYSKQRDPDWQKKHWAAIEQRLRRQSPSWARQKYHQFILKLEKTRPREQTVSHEPRKRGPAVIPDRIDLNQKQLVLKTGHEMKLLLERNPSRPTGFEKNMKKMRSRLYNSRYFRFAESFINSIAKKGRAWIEKEKEIARKEQAEKLPFRLNDKMIKGLEKFYKDAAREYDKKVQRMFPDNPAEGHKRLYESMLTGIVSFIDQYPSFAKNPHEYQMHLLTKLNNLKRQLRSEDQRAFKLLGFRDSDEFVSKRLISTHDTYIKRGADMMNHADDLATGLGKIYMALDELEIAKARFPEVPDAEEIRFDPLHKPEFDFDIEGFLQKFIAGYFASVKSLESHERRKLPAASSAVIKR